VDNNEINVDNEGSIGNEFVVNRELIVDRNNSDVRVFEILPVLFVMIGIIGFQSMEFNDKIAGDCGC